MAESAVDIIQIGVILPDGRVVFSINTDVNQGSVYDPTTWVMSFLTRGGTLSPEAETEKFFKETLGTSAKYQTLVTRHSVVSGMAAQIRIVKFEEMLKLRAKKDMAISVLSPALIKAVEARESWQLSTATVSLLKDDLIAHTLGLQR